jgi:uncharacterized protein (TIGR01615 family)
MQTVAWYDELLLSVPEAYTGPPARLRTLVRLLSGEMATAFAAAGAVTPPWRSAGGLGDCAVQAFFIGNLKTSMLVSV